MKKVLPESKMPRILFRIWTALAFCILLAAPQLAQADPQRIDGPMFNEITSQAGGNTQLRNWLMAMSLQETGGASVWTAANAASSAIGPMQQLVAFRQGCAAFLGTTFATLTANLLNPTPPTAANWAVKCAIWYYNGPLSSCTNISAKLCGYFRGPGFCLGASSIGLAANPSGTCGYAASACRKAGIDCGTGAMGTDPVSGGDNVQTGTVNNPTTGQTGTINCQSLDLSRAMQEASAAFGNAAIVNARTVFEASPRSDIRNTQCLTSGFFGYFDLIRALLGGISAIVAVINGIVASILRMVCDYVNQAIANLINTALSLLCIPSLPGLNFGLNLGALPFGRSSCSGISLLSFGGGGSMGATGGMPAFLTNMSRGIPGSGGFRF